MTSLNTSEINTHQITLHSQKIRPIRADNSTKDKSGNPKNFSKTKKSSVNRNSLDMTANHKTYGEMKCNLITLLR